MELLKCGIKQKDEIEKMNILNQTASCIFVNSEEPGPRGGSPNPNLDPQGQPLGPQEERQGMDGRGEMG